MNWVTSKYPVFMMVGINVFMMMVMATRTATMMTGF